MTYPLIIPARDPKQCGGGGKKGYCTIGDDDDDDDDDGEVHDEDEDEDEADDDDDDDDDDGDDNDEDDCEFHDEDEDEDQADDDDDDDDEEDEDDDDDDDDDDDHDDDDDDEYEYEYDKGYKDEDGEGHDDMMRWMLRTRRKMMMLRRVMLRRKTYPKTRSTICASLRSRNAHGQVTRAILRGNLQDKLPGTPLGTAFCASLRNRNAHGHFARAILCWNLEKLPACAVEMHMGISQEPLCVEIYRENAGRVWEHLAWTAGLYTYRKKPSVWPHYFGKNGDIQLLWQITRW